MRRTGPAAVVLAVAALVPTVAWAQSPPPRVPSTDLLPPVAPDEPAPDAAPVCGEHGLVCVRYVEAELADWEQHFGCDHRAVFPTVYRLLTRQTRLVLEQDPTAFDDPAGLGLEALRFYELYAEMLGDHLAGRDVPESWQLAMDAAQEGDWTAGHDMLLAINAHVQRDMPFAVADVGLVLPDGRTRKHDHDRFNDVLNAAYRPIVQAVARRYDPLMGDVEALPVVDDVGANQLVAGWREGVWRNAESLVTTAGSPLHGSSEAAIEANASTWARAIRTGQVPGHREVRDAHCRAALEGPQEGPTTGSTEDATADTGTADATDLATVTAVADGSTDAEPRVRDRPLPTSGGGAASGLAVIVAGWWLLSQGAGRMRS